MTIGEVLESFIRIPERAQSIEKGLEYVVSSLSNVQTLLGIVQKGLHGSGRPDQTFVYLLPPDYDEPAFDPPIDELIGALPKKADKPRPVRAPIYAHAVRLARDERTQIVFPGYYDIPPGIWVVAVGPALVKGVRVGNMIQEGVASDFSGHVCKTRDRWQVGVNLIVHLEGE